MCRRLSFVMFVRPTQPVEIFCNISAPFGTVETVNIYEKNLRSSSQGNPSVGAEVKRMSDSQI